MVCDKKKCTKKPEEEKKNKGEACKQDSDCDDTLECKPDNGDEKHCVDPNEKKIKKGDECIPDKNDCEDKAPYCNFVKGGDGHAREYRCSDEKPKEPEKPMMDAAKCPECAHALPPHRPSKSYTSPPAAPPLWHIHGARPNPDARGRGGVVVVARLAL